MTTDQREIEAALATNDIAKAAELARKAVAAGRRSAMLFNLVAWQCEEKGDFAGAHGWLEQALILSPKDPLILAAIGSALRKEGKLDEALAALDAAIAREPRLPAAWLDRGYALEAGGSLFLAEDSFRRSTVIDPTSAPAWGSLAGIAARLGKHDDARDAAVRALALDPQQPIAIVALVRIAIDDGAFDEAEDRLRNLLRVPGLAVADRLMALNLLGDVLDRNGSAEDAFAAYASANRAFDTLHAKTIAKAGERIADFVARIDAKVATIAPAAWKPAPQYHGPQPAIHAFLLGFPRSGTTLVENILASLGGAAAIEERPTLEMADRAFLLDRGGIDRLVKLSDPEPLQRAYWEKVAAAGVALDAKLFVDMDPMKGVRLPIIARLFPQAKIIVMRRDPRDVVWSCFHTAFAFAGSAIEFTSLERTARLYDAMMQLTERAIGTLPIDAHILRYDRLVTDFDATTRALCEFLGMAWTDKLRQFDKTAQQRGVTTASAGQVRRGLYDGRGQWAAYADKLAPIMPILDPWIDKFGFRD